jgi:solute:Na+ symporter, SSS family
LMPMALPLLYGMFIKRTPAWSAWSTVLVGFGVSYITQYRIDPEHVRQWLGWQQPLSAREAGDLRLAMATLGTVAIGSTWFFGTSLFYGFSSDEHQSRVAMFIANLRTPIDAVSEGLVNRDEVIYRLMGLLCLIYGAFIACLTVLPNSMRGRLCFVFCGGVMLCAGSLLYLRSRVMRKRADKDLSQPPAEAYGVYVKTPG